MPDARNAPQQQTLEFGLADGSARDRLVQLGSASHDWARLHYRSQSGNIKHLLRLIYDQTGEGIGPEWSATDDMILGHALGPEFEKSTFYKIRRALTEAGILSVDKHRAEDGQLRRHYRILWSGMYRVRGLPLPEQLRGLEAAEFHGAEFHGAEFHGAEFHGAEFHGAEFHGAEKPAPVSRSIPAPAPAGAPADARLSSFLSSLSVVVDDYDKDKPLQEDVRARANALRGALFPAAKLDTETRRFIATVAALAAVAQRSEAQFAEWIDYAVDVTTRAMRNRLIHKPIAFFKGTLRASLVDFLGLCATEDEAKATMGRLMAAARPLARPFLCRSQQSAAKEQLTTDH